MIYRTTLIPKTTPKSWTTKLPTTGMLKERHICMIEYKVIRVHSTIFVNETVSVSMETSA